MSVDGPTLDLIENALLNVRFEMDEVVRRAAMSPMIREQHDEFPMVCDRHGRMVVGQFGSYIPGIVERLGGDIRRGRRDPLQRSLPEPGLDHASQRLVRRPADLRRRAAHRLRVDVRAHDGRGRQGRRQPGQRRDVDLGGGPADPAGQDRRGRRPEPHGARRHPQQHPDAGHERERPPRAHRRVPDGGDAGDRAVRALRHRRVRGGVRRAHRPHARRPRRARAPLHPRGARHVHRLGRRRRDGQRPVQDRADRVADRRRLPRRLDGHRRAGAGHDQLPHQRRACAGCSSGST